MPSIAKAETAHGTIMIYRDDPTVGRSLRLYGEYCQPEIDLIIQYTHNNSWFFDIGANIGSHTVPVSHHVRKVLAFEPDAQNYDLLVKNVTMAGVKSKVVASKLAIGHTSQKINTVFDYGKTVCVQGDKIPMCKLDDITLIDRCDFIKIDVEGYEPHVLFGAQETIKLYKPHLLIEMQNEQNYKLVFDFLQKNGYNIYWMPVATYNPYNWAKNKQDVFGPQHGVLNWFATTETTTLDPVLDASDTIEKLVRRNA
jgi:FkbM family methyltransferase